MVCPSLDAGRVGRHNLRSFVQDSSFAESPGKELGVVGVETIGPGPNVLVTPSGDQLAHVPHGLREVLAVGLYSLRGQM